FPLASLLWMIAGCSPPPAPAPAPTPTPPAPSLPTPQAQAVSQQSGSSDSESHTVAPAESKSSPREQYGEESYRLVDQRDEIVAVLKNGMTVITRRMPSPVVSVRGVTWAGGIYEGKWLGGGLSHLLEHLVAGGSSERRTEA